MAGNKANLPAKSLNYARIAPIVIEIPDNRLQVRIDVKNTDYGATNL